VTLCDLSVNLCEKKSYTEHTEASRSNTEKNLNLSDPL